jgi:hypothetical protein
VKFLCLHASKDCRAPRTRGREGRDKAQAIRSRSLAARHMRHRRVRASRGACAAFSPNVELSASVFHRRRSQ